jgi:hypothetical protein
MRSPRGFVELPPIGALDRIDNSRAGPMVVGAIRLSTSVVAPPQPRELQGVPDARPLRPCRTSQISIEAEREPRVSHSEIRFVRARHSGVLSGVVHTRVVGAYRFRPFAKHPPIRYDRRPRHREDAFILDGELELQTVALIV